MLGADDVSILAADQPVRERRNQREHPQYTKPELVATAPNQTWSWDITKLLGPTKWTYFYSTSCSTSSAATRSAGMVADRENSALAGRLIEETCHKQGVQPQVLTLHSDRGAPMTSKCTAQLLADLGVTRSLSRPQVSDDNPFSEAQFKTLKYHPGFPGRFHDITAAIAFCRTFFPWYNTEHRHGGIAMLTPDDVHQQSNPERAGAARADPSSRLDPSSNASFEGSHNRIPSPSRLDQPTCDTHNRRNCSVNRNRHCLKVVDRFRIERRPYVGLTPIEPDPRADLPPRYRRADAVTLPLAGIGAPATLAGRIEAATGLAVRFTGPPRRTGNGTDGDPSVNVFADAGRDGLSPDGGIWTGPLDALLDSWTEPSGYEWRYDADRQAIEIVRRRSAIFQIHALAGKQHYTVSSSTQDSAAGGDGEGSGGGNLTSQTISTETDYDPCPRSKAS